MILSRSRAETLGHGILIFGRKIGHKSATKPLASESAVRFHCPHNIHAASGHRLHSLNKGGINDDDSDPMRANPSAPESYVMSGPGVDPGEVSPSTLLFSMVPSNILPTARSIIGLSIL